MTTGTRAVAGGTTLAILAIFVLSGAAGLIYEIVWSRQLVLVFGNTTQAVSAILTGFFGGMAIGAAVGGRIADRVRSPLRMYGILELALVVVVLVTPISFRLIHEVYRGIYPALEDAPQLLALVRLVLAVLALAPATILMGATFPSLTRHLARSSAPQPCIRAPVCGEHPRRDRRDARRGPGPHRALRAVDGASRSGRAARRSPAWRRWSCPVAMAHRTAESAPVVPSATAAPAARAASVSRDAGPGYGLAAIPARVRLALLIAFISGLTSLGYQVTWTRLLASGTGNTTYVFT